MEDPRVRLTHLLEQMLIDDFLESIVQFLPLLMENQCVGITRRQREKKHITDNINFVESKRQYPKWLVNTAITQPQPFGQIMTT